MRKIFSLCLLCFYSILSVKSQAPGITWEKKYTDSSYALFNFVLESADSNYLVCGNIFPYGGQGGGSSDVFLRKIDREGNVLWTENLPNLFQSVGIVSDFKKSSDGNCLILTYDWDSSEPSWDIRVVKVDENGSILFDGLFGDSDNDLGDAIAPTTDGGCLIAGVSSNGTAGKPRLWRIDGDGNLVWEKKYQSLPNGRATNAALLSDGGFAVAIADIDQQTLIPKTDILKISQNGDSVFATQASCECYPNAVAESSSDGSIILVVDNQNQDKDYALLKISASGAILKENYFSMPGQNFLRRIVPDGNSFVSIGFSFDADLDILVVKIDQDADTIWTKTIGLPGKTENGFSINLTSDNGYIIAGSFKDGLDAEPLNYDLYLVKVGGNESVGITKNYLLSNSDISLSPNPLTSSATLRISNFQKYASDDFELKIYNVLEQEVLKQNITNQKTEIKRENLPSGIYFYQLKNEKRILGNGKLVIE